MAAVTVRLMGSAQGRPVEKVHDGADDITVDDLGCLLVTAGEGKAERTLALYAPGVWVCGEVR